MLSSLAIGRQVCKDATIQIAANLSTRVYMSGTGSREVKNLTKEY
jgi:hypothetical protein